MCSCQRGLVSEDIEGHGVVCGSLTKRGAIVQKPVGRETFPPEVPTARRGIDNKKGVLASQMASTPWLCARTIREDAYVRRGTRHLRDCNLFIEIDILDGVQNIDTLIHRALERFPAADESGAAGALVDHCRADGLLEIILAGSAARVD